MPEALKSLAWVDIVGLVLISAFLILGLWRGLWWQVVRLLGVVAAIGLARGFTPRLEPSFAEMFPEMSVGLREGIVWFALFVAGLVAASLLGMLGKKALDGMQLSMVDRVGGGVAGLLTGANLHGAFLIGLVTFGGGSWANGQLEGTGSKVLLDTVVRTAPLLLDAEAAERLLGPVQDELDKEGDPEADPELDLEGVLKDKVQDVLGEDG